MRKNRRGPAGLAAILMLCVCVLSGCGYHAGHAWREFTAAGPIAVPIFFNATPEPELEKVVTEAVISRLQANGIQVGDKSAAGLILSGKITGYKSKTALSFDALRKIQEYRLRIVVQVTLTNVRTGEILWQTDNLSAVAEYFVGQTAVATQDAEHAAQKVAAYKLSQNIVDQWEIF